MVVGLKPEQSLWPWGGRGLGENCSLPWSWLLGGHPSPGLVVKILVGDRVLVGEVLPRSAEGAFPLPNYILASCWRVAKIATLVAGARLPSYLTVSLTGPTLTTLRIGQFNSIRQWQMPFSTSGWDT